MPVDDIASNLLTEAVVPSRTIVLVIAERARRDGKYTAHCNDELIVADSRQPFVDAARILLNRGVNPASPLVMRRSLDGPDVLRSIVGAAAKLTVEETPLGPRFNIWRPFPTEGA